MKISATIPAYNAAAYIDAALDSIEAQTRPPDEIVLIDDGSTDGTGDIAEARGVRVVRQRNSGIAAARNRCVAEARHELIAMIDADDLWMPHHLETLLGMLGEHVMAWGDAVRLFEDGAETETYVDRSTLRDFFDVADDRPTVLGETFYKPLMIGCFTHHNAMLFRKTDAIRAGLWDPGQTTSSDRLFSLRLAMLGTSIFDPTVHTHVRIHRSNTTGSHRFLEVAWGRVRVLDRVEESIRHRGDADDVERLAELRAYERERIRRLASERGLGSYFSAPGAFADIKGIARAVRTSLLRRGA